MTQLTLIATITARPGREDAVEAALRDLAVATRKEEGCIAYDLHRAIDRPGTFVFYEIWRSRADHAQHDETPHIKAFRANSGDIVQSVELTFLERI